MNRIKFGTDGWRAVIAQDFTVESVARLAMACSSWLLNKYREATVVIGYDCRYGGKMFAEAVAKVLGSKGIKVIMSDRFTATPVVSFVVNMMKAEMGIIITASHNPPEYNGIKIKGPHGGPFFEEDLRDIENLVKYENHVDLDLIRLESLIEKDLLIIGNIEEYYIQHIKESFNLNLLNKAAGSILFDPMYGSGQNILGRIIPGLQLVNHRQEWMFNNTPPEPLEKNLSGMLSLLRSTPSLKLGVAVDGDADRIALADEQGTYIDSHHIILLLIHYLAGYKRQTGSVVTGFSSTVKIEKLAAHYQLPVTRVKIGFKEISRIMLKEDVLVGGEESGGISVKGHIPERDGIWMALLIIQWMNETGKSLRQLIEEIYSITGPFAYARSDLKIEKEVKTRFLEKCRNGALDCVGQNKIVKKEDLDGYKFFISGESWVMVRASGTEPVLRTYAEAATGEDAKLLLNLIREEILKS
jgi:phosphomannomutase